MNPSANIKHCSVECFHRVPDLNRKWIHSVWALMKYLKKHRPLPLRYTWTATSLSPILSMESGRSRSSQLPQEPPVAVLGRLAGGDLIDESEIFQPWTWSLNWLSFEQCAKWLKQVLLCIQSCLYILIHARISGLAQQSPPPPKKKKTDHSWMKGLLQTWNSFCLSQELSWTNRILLKFGLEKCIDLLTSLQDLDRSGEGLVWLE